MANDIVPFDSAVPAHVAARLNQPSALAGAVSAGLSSGVEYPRISIKGARFRIVQGGAETLLPDITLAIVVVGANPGLSKAFYLSAWDPSADNVSPDCYTLDGIRPDPSSSQPQNDLCATCPHNAWGSKITDAGVKVKACSDKKRLAVVAADDPSGPIYLIEVTAAALKGLNQYNRELQMRGIAPEIAKTIVSFDASASFPKLKFDFGGFLSGTTQAVVDGLFGTAEVLEITGEGDALALAAPAQAAAPATPPPAVAEQPALDNSAQPEPVAAFGQPAVAQPAAQPAVAQPAVAQPAVAQPAVAQPAEQPSEAAPAGFGQPAAAQPAAAQPVMEEPAAATVVPSGTDGLADEITNLMKDIADDAPTAA